jgi:adenylate cyclase class IV
MELEVVLRDEQSIADGVRIADQLMHELGLARAERIAGAYLDLLVDRRA